MLDSGNQLLADLLAERSQGELKFDLIGDDIVLRAAVNRSDGNDRGLARLDFSADDRL